MRLAHLLHHSAQPATAHGVTIGTPGHYDVFTNLFFLGRRKGAYQALVRAAGVAPGQRVLDVGCGTGYFARLLAEAVGATGHVVGIDAAPEMVEYATQHARHIPSCEFQVGTAEALAFPAAHFDVVVSSLFMHHLPQPLQSVAIAEMLRVLAPGGTLLVADMRVPNGLGWRLLAGLIGATGMERNAQRLESLVTSSGSVTDLETSEAVPWMRYVRAVKSSNNRPNLS
ncbi:MAG TPA: class I SAM-dependent methyltransferase [Chloroflexota bacterium]|nr:class I SAM-dependent methyltransferase [Chloroflexota bacterium]